MMVQAPPAKGVHSIHSHGGTVETNDDLEGWQKHFNRQFHHLFRRVGGIRNYNSAGRILREFNSNPTKG